jgi:hypothetical protein
MTAIAQRRVAGATALMIMFYLLQVVLFGVSPARADHVEPQFVDGNLNCEAVTGTAEVLRLEDSGLKNGDYAVSGGVITVTGLTSHTFSWSTDGLLISAVFIKAGNGGWLYDYLPAGATSDSNVGAQGQQAISHITFCTGGFTTTTTEPTTTTTEPTTTTTEATTTTTTTEATTTTTTQPVTTTVPQVTTTVPEVTTTIPFDELPEPEPAEVLGETIVAEVVADTLPFTGFETEDTAKLGLLALVAGGLMLFAVRGRDEEEVEIAVAASWSNH